MGIVWCFIPAREFLVDSCVVGQPDSLTIFSLALSILTASQPVKNSICQRSFLLKAE